LIQAAKYLGVDPEWLLDRPACWQQWALACRNIEIAGEAEYLKRHRHHKKGS